MTPLRLVLFANNRVGLAVAQYLRQRDDEIVAVVVHPEHRARFRREIVRATGVAAECVRDSAGLAEPEGLDWLASLSPSIGVSAFFGDILAPQVIGLFPRGIINIHPAFLPYNRGVNTNVWSIVEGTPAGATIHYIDKGIDTGDIVAQVPVPVLPTDTGQSLYRRLEQACIAVFSDTWPGLIAGTAPRIPQVAGAGTFHRHADVAGIDEIDLDCRYTGRELIDRIRARSFPPYLGTYFIAGGRKVYLRLEFQESEPEGRGR